jgi:peptidyl-Asp metalloendopeptidase
MFNLAKTIPPIAGATLLALCMISPALAQTKTAAAADEVNEQVVITDLPAQQSRVRAFLARVFGKGKKEKSTGSEVLTVPKEKSAWLIKRLEALGCKVVKLRANWEHILGRPKGQTDLTPAQKDVIDTAMKSPETVNVGVLNMPDAAIAELALTRFEQSVGTKGQGGPPQDRYAKVILPLDATRDVTLVRTHPPIFTEKGVTWNGEVEDTGEKALLMLWKDGHLSGYFGYKGRVFVVSHMGNEVHTMREIDPLKLPPDHSPGFKGNPETRDASPVPVRPASPSREPVVAPLPEAERKALEAKKITIDVMMLYTKNAAKHYIRDPADLLELAIEQSNATFRNSGISNVSVRLVHSQAIDYDEKEVDQFDTLYRMVDGLGAFKDVRKLRNEKRADIVGLVVDDPNGCGLSTRVGADADEAFFVVHHTCAAITYSIAHEIGHILGTRHDRLVDGNESPFPYGHGYVNGPKWRDMMSYIEGCGGCPRIPFWSNPRIRYKGEPTGTLASDNARVILEQAERVANFR